MRRLISSVLLLTVLGCGSPPRESPAPEAATREPAAATPAAQPPAPGERAPDFELTDHTGKVRRLSDARGQTMVLVFYRGYW